MCVAQHQLPALQDADRLWMKTRRSRRGSAAARLHVADERLVRRDDDIVLCERGHVADAVAAMVLHDAHVAVRELAPRLRHPLAHKRHLRPCFGCMRWPGAATQHTVCMGLLKGCGSLTQHTSRCQSAASLVQQTRSSIATRGNHYAVWHGKQAGNGTQGQAAGATLQTTRVPRESICCRSSPLSGVLTLTMAPALMDEGAGFASTSASTSTVLPSPISSQRKPASRSALLTVKSRSSDLR